MTAAMEVLNKRCAAANAEYAHAEAEYKAACQRAREMGHPSNSEEYTDLTMREWRKMQEAHAVLGALLDTRDEVRRSEFLAGETA